MADSVMDNGTINWLAGIMFGIVIGLALSLTAWWQDFGDDGL